MELATCYSWNSEYSQSDEHRQISIQSENFRTACFVTELYTVLWHEYLKESGHLEDLDTVAMVWTGLICLRIRSCERAMNFRDPKNETNLMTLEASIKI
jgi:hypothetical protein